MMNAMSFPEIVENFGKLLNHRREGKMGITYMEGRVRGATGKEKEVRFLIDSGATYTLLPKEGNRAETEEGTYIRPCGWQRGKAKGL
ncbi:MAG: retroviral-like aspartic protease family protein [Canidatus Methanoxibalbensis ujae]|nr:retroviral-like aspartic protease family protein [Candidatus Methanoxibalbensis ujae]